MFTPVLLEVPVQMTRCRCGFGAYDDHWRVCHSGIYPDHLAWQSLCG